MVDDSLPIEIPQIENEELQPQETFFSGQLRTNASSYLLAPEDFTVLKNYRYTPMGIKGRYGMSQHGSDSGYIVPHVKADGSTVIHYRANPCTYAQVAGEIFIGDSTGIKRWDYDIPTPAWVDLGDDWSGDWLYPNGALVGIKDYTGFVYLDNTSTYLEAGGLMPPFEEIYLGFMDIPTEIWLDIAPDARNTNTSVMTLSCWAGPGTPAYVDTTETDGTSTSGDTLGKSGQLTNITSTNAATSTKYGIPHALYWYKITVSAPLSGDVNIWQVRAKPASKPPVGYTAVVAFKQRLWLYGNENIFSYSKRNYPEVWNGNDSSILEIGENQPVSVAQPFHNEMTVFKRTGEVGLVEGYSPATFAYEMLASYSGAVAARSIVPVETGVLIGATKRTVTIYMSSDGFRRCDGLSTPLISQDISAYFDKNDSRCIAVADMSAAVSWMDYQNNEYHCTVPNTGEFVYGIESGKWSLFDRTLGVGDPVWSYDTLTAGSWASSCWSSDLNMFAAADSSSTTADAVTTSPTGETWTPRTVTGTYVTGICAGDNKFVAIGQNCSITSSDGISWNAHANSLGGYPESVCYNPTANLYVAVGANWTSTSTDGETWSPVVAEAGGWTSVCWADTLGLYVAVAVSGTNRAMTSPDGLSWTTHPVEGNPWVSVCWSSALGKLVAVAYSGSSRVMTSLNGTDWLPHAVTASTWYSVCWGAEAGKFLMVATTGTYKAATSTDGETWNDFIVDAKPWDSTCWSPELMRFLSMEVGGAADDVMLGQMATPSITNAVTFFNDNEWLTLAGTAIKIYKLEDSEADDGAAITYIAESKDHWQNSVINYRKFMLQASHFASGTVTLSHALDGVEIYTSDGNMDISKTGHRFCMPVGDLNLNGSSVRWKIETTKRLELYKYLTYSKPVRDLKDHPGN